MRTMSAILMIIGLMWVGEQLFGDGAGLIIVLALVLSAIRWLQDN